MKKLLIFLVSLLALNNLSAQRYTETYIKDANKIGLEWWNQIKPILFASFIYVSVYL